MVCLGSNSTPAPASVSELGAAVHSCAECLAWPGLAWLVLDGLALMTWLGLFWLGLAGLGWLAWIALPAHGRAWQVPAWLGLAWLGFSLASAWPALRLAWLDCARRG